MQPLQLVLQAISQSPSGKLAVCGPAVRSNRDVAMAEQLRRQMLELWQLQNSAAASSHFMPCVCSMSGVRQNCQRWLHQPQQCGQADPERRAVPSPPASNAAQSEQLAHGCSMVTALHAHRLAIATCTAASRLQPYFKI